MSYTSLSVVIPVFNNSDSLFELHDRLSKVLKSLASVSFKQIVYVNDGSVDDSLLKLHALNETSDKDLSLKIVDLVGNHGQQNATFAGLFNSDGQVIVVLSADLQDPPELITQMLDLMNSGSSVVVGLRKNRSDSKIRKLGSAIVYSLVRIGNKRVPVSGFDYIMFERSAMHFIFKKKQLLALSQVHILESGLPIDTLEYSRLERRHGKSQWRLDRLIKVALEILAYSMVSIARHAVYFGLFFIIISLLLFTYIFLGAILGQLPFRGFALISGLIVFFGGLILSLVGAIFIYISREYDRALPKDSFLVREIFTNSNGKNVKK